MEQLTDTGCLISFLRRKLVFVVKIFKLRLAPRKSMPASFFGRCHRCRFFPTKVAVAPIVNRFLVEQSTCRHITTSLRLNLIESSLLLNNSFNPPSKIVKFMINTDKSVIVIREIFESLQRSGTISAAALFSHETVLLGINSQLDSLGFVTFISDLEERISADTGRDIYLVLEDIGEFNLNNPSLTVKALATYVAKLTG